MGSWFSNMHIRKNGIIEKDFVVEYIREIMATKNYIPTESKDESDGAFAILSDENSQWYSVYSDLFSFDDPKVFSDNAASMSEKLKTDILGISCFDSDFIYLNLINSKENVDAWARVGTARETEIRRRTNLSAWKNKVDDHTCFKSSLKKEYVFAEEVLAEIEHCIHLPNLHSSASYEDLSDMELTGGITYLYFNLPKEYNTTQPPKFKIRTAPLSPAFLEKPEIISYINTGDRSKGLSIFFTGPYVENDEITFSDLSFIISKNNKYERIPFELKKGQLTTGEWVYYYHDPEFVIMPKVNDKLPPMKHYNMECDRSISIRFIPHGNARKILDITVVLVPDKNLQGQAGWNVWHRFGSKKEYIRYINETWSKRPNREYILLCEEDFD